MTQRRAVACAFARSVRAQCLSSQPLSNSHGRSLAAACLDHGLERLAPSSCCAVLHGFALRGWAHSALMEAAVRRMSIEALRQCSSSALCAWLAALSALRAPVSCAYLGDCLAALDSRAHRKRLPFVAAVLLLRAVLLAEVRECDEGLRHGAALLGNVLSRAVAFQPLEAAGIGTGTGTGTAADAARMPLADVAWLLKHRPPSWLRQVLAPHHEAVLELVWQQGRPTSVRTVASRWRVQAEDIECSVAAALERLGSRPQRGLVQDGIQLPLTLPERRVAILCPGVGGWIQDLSIEEDTHCLHPVVQMRKEQLQLQGWQAEVILRHQWPLYAEGPGCEEILRQQELQLRKKLAGALQARVPQRRQRHDLHAM